MIMHSCGDKLTSETHSSEREEVLVKVTLRIVSDLSSPMFDNPQVTQHNIQGESIHTSSTTLSSCLSYTLKNISIFYKKVAKVPPETINMWIEWTCIFIELRDQGVTSSLLLRVVSMKV